MQAGVSTLGTAVSWGASLATGSLATALAVLAVAWLGVTMLQGHLVWREHARVVLGCFILFGAPVIAKGLMNAALGVSSGAPLASSKPPAPLLTPPAAPQFDPYAGAALPR